MENENNFTIETITGLIQKAVQETKDYSSKEINAAYEAEIEAYRQNSVPPCTKAESLKLLKRFGRKCFHDFWISPVAEYLPAVSEGTMKLNSSLRPHGEAIRYAKDLIATLSPVELAKDFLYGVSHNVPEYRTALACYHYVKNLPEHDFEKKFVGSIVGKDGEWVDKYNETTCEICGYRHAPHAEPKMQFYHANTDTWWFYSNARIPFRIDLNSAILFLEEYKRLPRPAHESSDLDHFKSILAVIDNAPIQTTSGKLRKVLKQSGLLTMTMEQIEAFIDMLGYLNILHPADSFGVTAVHTCERDMLLPLNDRGYAAYPVNRWTRACGIDFDSVSMLFDHIY